MVNENVHDITPALVAGWARQYIRIYTRDGSDAAKKWALGFLKGPNLQAMTNKVNEMLHKGGGGTDG